MSPSGTQLAVEPPFDERPLETTAFLLERIRAGDETAKNLLLSRYRPALLRWAHGRLPHHARDLSETSDLVQNTLVRALNHLEGFEPRRPGAFLAYLRRILLNIVTDEIRRVRVRPLRTELDEQIVGHEPSPIEVVIGREKLAAYEAALERLTEQQQEAIVLSIEFGLPNAEVQEAMALSSPNAARMLVARGLVRLAKEMEDDAPAG